MNTYKMKQFLFQWNAETEEDGGSVVFTFCKVLHFLKYKDSTLIYFGKDRFQRARKHVAAFEE